MKHRQHNMKSSSYFEITIYDKQKETEQRVSEGKADKKELEKYRNTVRTEAKIKNGKLNSNKSYDKKHKKETIREKILETYYNNEAAEKYYSERAKKIYGSEKFYRIDVALKKIQDCENISKNVKDKLCALIKLVNKEGISNAKKIWVDTFSVNTFNNHVKLIRKLDINIITFDKKIDGIEVNYEYILNFSLLENCIN